MCAGGSFGLTWLLPFPPALGLPARSRVIHRGPEKGLAGSRLSNVHFLSHTGAVCAGKLTHQARLASWKARVAAEVEAAEDGWGSRGRGQVGGWCTRLEMIRLELQGQVGDGGRSCGTRCCIRRGIRGDRSTCRLAASVTGFPRASQAS